MRRYAKRWVWILATAGLMCAALPAAAQDNDGDGYTVGNGDCNDNDATVYPGAPELCDGIDNDCDGFPAVYEQDNDGDGYMECEECDDTDPMIYPGAMETCDGVDNNCDGQIDEGCNAEICDNHDDDDGDEIGRSSCMERE